MISPLFFMYLQRLFVVSLTLPLPMWPTLRSIFTPSNINFDFKWYDHQKQHLSHRMTKTPHIIAPLNSTSPKTPIILTDSLVPARWWCSKQSYYANKWLALAIITHSLTHSLTLLSAKSFGQQNVWTASTKSRMWVSELINRRVRRLWRCWWLKCNSVGL